MVNRDICCGCTACKEICGKNAIVMQADEMGFLYPVINQELCIDCDACNKVCPCENNNFINSEQKTVAYACYNKNENIRKESTSGGVFTIISEWILQQGGIVYAATFNEKFVVIHDSAETSDEVVKFRGSKYIQSDLNGVYKRIKKDLIENKLILFVGTPCQNAGLQNYVGKNRQNLFCIDMICMGVGSPMIWQAYVSGLNKTSKLKNFTFKDKNKGWHNYEIRIEYDNKIEYEQPKKNLYMQGYLQHLYFRPYCYECEFKGIERSTDWTIADCWGIDKIFPEMDDNKGISAIYIHSTRGKDVFKQISTQMIYKEISIDEIKKYNKHLEKAAEKNKNYSKFWKDYMKYGYSKTMKNYCDTSIYYKIQRKIKRIICGE